MKERKLRPNTTLRVVRPGQAMPPDDDWQSFSVEERIAAVWELTKLCWDWSQREKVNQDFKDLLSAFNDLQVKYLVVGAHALAAHGHVRATKDLDVWVHASAKNASRVIRAWQEFGAPLHDLSEKDLSQPGVVFQIGVPPLRIDVLTKIDGVTFEAA